MQEYIPWDTQSEDSNITAEDVHEFLTNLTPEQFLQFHEILYNTLREPDQAPEELDFSGTPPAVQQALLSIRTVDDLIGLYEFSFQHDRDMDQMIAGIIQTIVYAIM